MSYVIVDTTLRDGEQRPGMAFTRSTKLAVAGALDQLGVGVIEAGIPALGPEERTTLDLIHSLGLRAEILVWNRLHEADLGLCLVAGYPAVHLSVPVSDAMIRGKLRRDRRWVLDQIDRVVGRAADAGCRVSFGAEDASRAELPFLLEVYRRAVAAGARRVRFADTLGVLTPRKTGLVLARLTAEVPVPLDYHGHNDLGLATANSVSAWEAGARYLSCSLLGWGERAGNAALEEVVAALEFGLGVDTPLKAALPGIVGLGRRLAEAQGTSIDPHKPVVGERVFHHESGIHVDGLLKDSGTYEAWAPESFGGRRSLGIGKTSGTAGIIHLAAARGLPVNKAQAQTFLDGLRRTLGERPGVTPETLWEEFLARKGAPS